MTKVLKMSLKSIKPNKAPSKPIKITKAAASELIPPNESVTIKDIGVVTLSAATDALSCAGALNNMLSKNATTVALTMPKLHVATMSNRFFRTCVNC